ncbi:4-alpha-glucanotransferase [Bacteroidia bacterium]|nr:4-alpha-glucanotransferase [Bacteroidia bacterium]
MIQLKIHYLTEYGQTLKVIGNIKELGNNKLEDAPYMFHDGDGFWHLDIDVSSKKDFSYKYIIIDERTGQHWGEMYYPDRVFTAPISTEIDNNSKKSASKSTSKKSTSAKNTIIEDTWRTPYKGAGVAIPVFSIRTQEGLGIGEFNDIKIMADWASKCELAVIQVLPIYDTSVNFTYTDSYPYSAISVFALHPIYLNIEQLGTLTDKDKTTYNKLRKELNDLPQIDYEKIIAAKWKYIRDFYTKSGKETLESADYKTFYKNNKFWLDNYAVFCCLRDKYKTSDFSTWGKFSKYSTKLASSYIKDHLDEVQINFYVQYHLHKQLISAKNYAETLGVKLKGDLPIGVSRYSVETWTEPDLFNMEGQAGAPPDAFSTTGQIWGFPTYNWQKMAEDGYKWWKLRFQKMEEYFQLLRIDHILGFFRIWQVPLTAPSGLLGQFSPALPFSEDELCSRGLNFWHDRYCKPYIDSNVEEVLFLEDEHQKGYYHPRISLHYTKSYQDLDWQSKEALNHIYDDYFYRRHNQFWKEGALNKLRNIQKTTNVLLCGEDLGMVPDTVPEVMNELRILSLIIQRMPNVQTRKFADLVNAPYLSVCSPGSHDMAPLRAWWEEDINTTRDFYYNELHCFSECPEHCTSDIVKTITKQHLYSPSMWAIFPLQDLLAMDDNLKGKNPFEERINDPSNPKHYWRYRLHLNIEDLLKEKVFNTMLKSMVVESERH